MSQPQCHSHNLASHALSAMYYRTNVWDLVAPILYTYSNVVFTILLNILSRSVEYHEASGEWYSTDRDSIFSSIVNTTLLLLDIPRKKCPYWLQHHCYAIRLRCVTFRHYPSDLGLLYCVMRDCVIANHVLFRQAAMRAQSDHNSFVILSDSCPQSHGLDRVLVNSRLFYKLLLVESSSLSHLRATGYGPRA